MTPQGHRRLILTRHAKSAWDNPALSDHDRPLNTRGQRAARELGDWLASRGYEPDEVLCSPALRTRETWDHVAAAVLEVRPAVRYEAELYQAAPETLLAIAAKPPPQLRSWYWRTTPASPILPASFARIRR